jgi:hypothetical protein
MATIHNAPAKSIDVFFISIGVFFIVAGAFFSQETQPKELSFGWDDRPRSWVYYGVNMTR